MNNPETKVVELNDDFYRDSLQKVIGIMVAIGIGIGAIVATAFYLATIKPPKVIFSVGKEWRILAPVPVDQPYPATPDMLQWVSHALPTVFRYDFVNYNSQLKVASRYFTENGWAVFLNQLNNYVNYNKVQTYRMFVSSKPASAPFILNQGLILGRYGWWVQMPLTIDYQGNNQNAKQTLTLQVLVVRVPTEANLSGVGIDNVIVVTNNTNNAPVSNG